MSKKLRWTAALLGPGAPGTEVRLSAVGGPHARSQGGCEGQRWSDS